jgi:RNA polymerase sigma-70 factor (sigma-E family)
VRSHDLRFGLDLESFCHVQHPRLVRLLSLQCGDVETAQELTQDALVKVCQHWRKVRRMDEPAAWVTRVAVNLALSHHRRSAVRRRHAAVTGRQQARVDPADATDGWVVRAALANLPERRRTALVLRYFEDLSVEQTAEIMGISASAVKKLTARGVEQLRGLLHADIVESAEEAPRA